MAHLRLIDVSVHFGGLQALTEVSFDLRPGEILSLIGPNGAGKTTIFNVITGVYKISGGQVTYDDASLSGLRPHHILARGIARTFQNIRLFTAMTALENVSLPLIFRGMDKKKREEMARETLESVGLKGYEKRKPSQMSGGQQQRVGIARALVGNPKIIFADEPTGNLDTNTTAEVIALLQNQVRKHNQTLIMVTHDQTLAQFADRIVTIQDGNIIHEEPGNARNLG